MFDLKTKTDNTYQFKDLIMELSLSWQKKATLKTNYLELRMIKNSQFIITYIHVIIR